MARKKWTRQTDNTIALLKFRDKRKWQIALRRYVLEKAPCSFYAPYFGIDIENFRKWIELQFDSDLNWKNFSLKWQFEHIIPVTYFDFSNDDELRLCWNFTNLRVEKFEMNKSRRNRLDKLAAKVYFEGLYEKTGYPLCLKMVEKITRIEISEIASTKLLENFINTNRTYLDAILGFTSYEFGQLNNGLTVDQVVNEREFLKKFN